MPARAPTTVAPADIDAVRRFNRFHTRAVGALDEDLLDSGFSLTQVRVLYELAQHAESVASQLGDTLGLAESLDDSRAPVDKEVFMRELAYYEIRSQ